MKIIPFVLVCLCSCVLGQTIGDIPEAPTRLVPFYLPSQQSDVKAKLSSPYALAISRSGNVYVFDDGNSRIVKLNSRGKFLAEFGQPGSGSGQIKSAGLSDSLAVDGEENIYVVDAINPKVQIYNSSGAFRSSFRVPFPVASIGVNSKHEIFLTADTSRPSDLIYVFSPDGKFIRSFGAVLVRQNGRLARQANRSVLTVDQADNILVAFRSWPLIRKYSGDGKLLGEAEYKIPSGLVGGEEAKRYSIDFFSRNPDAQFSLPFLAHSISASRAGKVYVLLNGRVIVALGSDLRLLKQWAFRSPSDQKNLFVRLGLGMEQGYLLDVTGSAIYQIPRF
jgi:hypothetical protein